MIYRRLNLEKEITLNKILEFILDVEKEYLSFHEDVKISLNIHKLRTNKIYTNESLNGEFNKELQYYLDKIDDFEFRILEISSKYISEDFKVNMRKKSPDSIMSKIIRNSKDHIMVSRVLNDLFGVRCIVTDVDSFIEKLELKCKERDYRFLPKNNPSEDYRAHHIYIKGKDNFVFHIEVQIWDVKNEKMNLESHKKYKIGYVKAPFVYKGGE